MEPTPIVPFPAPPEPPADAAEPPERPPTRPPVIARLARTTPAQIVLVGLGTVAFLYFARPVVLPVFLACITAMALKPLVRWLTVVKLPLALASALVLALLVTAIGEGFVKLGRPAVAWVNDSPQHITDLRQRIQKFFPHLSHFTDAAAAVQKLGETELKKEETEKEVTTVEVKDNHGATSILNWTGSLLVGLGETLVLAFLLLASGDLFQQKLVHVMPTLTDKKRAVEISHEIQQNIAIYLFSMTLINLGLGLLVAGGLFVLGVPKAPMWGMLAAILNYVPYFGPFVGVLLLGMVGLLTFDTFWQALLPMLWYLSLHLAESNLVTPILMGRRFALNPVSIFVSLIFWTWLWGVPGALLSVPILVSVKVVCDRIPTLAQVSEVLASHHHPREGIVRMRQWTWPANPP